VCSASQQRGAKHKALKLTKPDAAYPSVAVNRNREASSGLLLVTRRYFAPFGLAAIGGSLLVEYAHFILTGASCFMAAVMIFVLGF